MSGNRGPGAISVAIGKVAEFARNHPGGVEEHDIQPVNVWPQNSSDSDSSSTTSQEQTNAKWIRENLQEGIEICYKGKLWEIVWTERCNHAVVLTAFKNMHDTVCKFVVAGTNGIGATEDVRLEQLENLHEKCSKLMNSAGLHLQPEDATNEAKVWLRNPYDPLEVIQYEDGTPFMYNEIGHFEIDGINCLANVNNLSSLDCSNLGKVVPYQYSKEFECKYAKGGPNVFWLTRNVGVPANKKALVSIVDFFKSQNYHVRENEMTKSRLRIIDRIERNLNVTQQELNGLLYGPNRPYGVVCEHYNKFIQWGTIVECLSQKYAHFEAVRQTPPSSDDDNSSSHDGGEGGSVDKCILFQLHGQMIRIGRGGLSSLIVHNDSISNASRCNLQVGAEWKGSIDFSTRVQALTLTNWFERFAQSSNRPDATGHKYLGRVFRDMIECYDTYYAETSDEPRLSLEEFFCSNPDMSLLSDIVSNRWDSWLDIHFPDPFSGEHVEISEKMLKYAFHVLKVQWQGKNCRLVGGLKKREFHKCCYALGGLTLTKCYGPLIAFYTQ
jgi:hypothetical protein